MKRMAIPFRDRLDAGRQLADELSRHHFENPLVLGIPRGGVAVSCEVARRLGCDHGVVAARKLRAPFQPELAIGAITADGVTYIDADLARHVGADESFISQEIDRQVQRAARYEESFDSHKRPQAMDRDVIIVDDGVATGATAIAAIRSMRAAGAQKVVFAVPVGPQDTLRRLRQEADEVIALHSDDTFVSVGQYYRYFPAIEDHQVRRILDRVDAETQVSG